MVENAGVSNVQFTAVRVLFLNFDFRKIILEYSRKMRIIRKLFKSSLELFLFDWTCIYIGDVVFF